MRGIAANPNPNPPTPQPSETQEGQSTEIFNYSKLNCFTFFKDSFISLSLTIFLFFPAGNMLREEDDTKNSGGIAGVS